MRKLSREETIWGNRVCTKKWNTLVTKIISIALAFTYNFRISASNFWGKFSTYAPVILASSFHKLFKIISFSSCLGRRICNHQHWPIQAWWWSPEQQIDPNWWCHPNWPKNNGYRYKRVCRSLTKMYTNEKKWSSTRKEVLKNNFWADFSADSIKQTDSNFQTLFFLKQRHSRHFLVNDHPLLGANT